MRRTDCFFRYRAAGQDCPVRFVPQKLQPAKRSDDIPVGVYGVDQADRGECDHCNQEKRDQAEAGFVIFGFIRIRENQRAEERAVLCDGNTEAALTDRLFW